MPAVETTDRAAVGLRVAGHLTKAASSQQGFSILPELPGNALNGLTGAELLAFSAQRPSQLAYPCGGRWYGWPQDPDQRLDPSGRTQSGSL